MFLGAKVSCRDYGKNNFEEIPSYAALERRRSQCDRYTESQTPRLRCGE